MNPQEANGVRFRFPTSGVQYTLLQGEQKPITVDVACARLRNFIPSIAESEKALTRYNESLELVLRSSGKELLRENTAPKKEVVDDEMYDVLLEKSKAIFVHPHSQGLSMASFPCSVEYQLRSSHALEKNERDDGTPTISWAYTTKKDEVYERTFSGTVQWDCEDRSLTQTFALIPQENADDVSEESTMLAVPVQRNIKFNQEHGIGGWQRNVETAEQAEACMRLARKKIVPPAVYANTMASAPSVSLSASSVHLESNENDFGIELSDDDNGVSEEEEDNDHIIANEQEEGVEMTNEKSTSTTEAMYEKKSVQNQENKRHEKSTSEGNHIHAPKNKRMKTNEEKHTRRRQNTQQRNYNLSGSEVQRTIIAFGGRMSVQQLWQHFNPSTERQKKKMKEAIKRVCTMITDETNGCYYLTLK